MSFGIIGAGAFGTALAVSLSGKYPEVILWGRDKAHMRNLQMHRENSRYLPGTVLPAALKPTADINQAAAQQTLLLAIPMQTLRQLV